MVGLSEREEKLFHVLQVRSLPRTNDLVQATGFNEREVRRLIKRLQAKGFMTVKGRMPWQYEINTPPNEIVLAQVSERMRVPCSEITSRNKSGRVVAARKRVVIKLIDVYGWTANHAAAAVNLQGTYVRNSDFRSGRAA